MVSLTKKSKIKYFKIKVWGILPQILIIDVYAIYIQTGNTDELNKISIISLKGESGNTIHNEKEFGVV